MDKEAKALKNNLGKKWIAMVIFLIALFLYSFTIGQFPISIPDLLHTMYYHFIDPSQIANTNMDTALFNIRLPRVLVAMIVGGGLAIAGAAYQGMFKNPMVSPDILGASAGAGFGAAIALYLSLSVVMVQTLAFFGSLLAVFLATNINKKMNYDPLLGLVLGGILISTLFSSGTSAIKFLADSSDKLPAITFWLMGGFYAVNKTTVITILPPILVALLILFRQRWKLNVLSFGEEEARSLGIKTKRVRGWVIFSATLITAASVSNCGMIGWIGLVIPHLGRAIVGPNYRDLLPVCGVLGAAYMLLVDNVARCLWSVEIPVGILTAILGVPFFVFIFNYSVKR